ncbi:hypothetical protein [Pontiella sulfatireligans]|uniref:Uncharacterized protein n=1 Tax=Pontiella sulfatireligans TaxID=2750658 RepID=A0A6C2USX6_9BACT|nr:hypothetical protein [Pontiella sulfatireligans]VGO22361.1 hypothetical protein SCARR_04444 [Pontiella sulfatireligans]
MKKQLPAILLAVVSIALALALYGAKQENLRLQQELASSKTTAEKAEAAPLEETVVAAVHPEAPVASSAPEAAPALQQPDMAGRQMMKSISSMMDNPTMNKVMEASQRGAVGALYSDMIEYLDLNAEETSYFMDLLMFRQMKNVDMAMKMMAGNLSEEEKKALQDGIKEAGETVKIEMEQFLNNPDDFSEWEFYEKTMGERMMLSQMDQNLSASDAALSDETYRNLLGMMSEEKSGFTFTSNLSDEKNNDMSPQRFSKQNIQNHINDVKKLNEQITARAQGMLTLAQYEEFEKSLKATTDMQLAQLEMAGQMFGGGEAPKAP